MDHRTHHGQACLGRRVSNGRGRRSGQSSGIMIPGEGGRVRYETVAEAYRDLEAATGRLALIDRMAELIRATPDDELARVCYLCQGLIAPEFAGIDLGLAEKLAIRAVAAAAGVEPDVVTAAVRARG